MRAIATRVLVLMLVLLAGCGPGAGGREPVAVADADADADSLVLVSPGSRVDVDVARRFVPGVPSRLEVRLSPETHGLVVVGNRVTGTFEGTGAVRVSAVATDARGVATSRVFNIVAPAAEPGRPQLPTVPFAYEDSRLNLPAAYEASGKAGAPYWDTTPQSNPVTDEGATLGRVLFHDRRLSSTNTHSCGTCHQQAHGFADPAPTSRGATGESTRRNAMGLANVRYNLRDRYFSDARVRTLEALALEPIQDPVEMANTLPNVVARLQATDFYPPLFQAAFGSPQVTAERIGMALAQFLRSLVSYRARLDAAYPEGGGTAFPMPSPLFSELENEGLGLLIEGNCLHCHVDPVLTMVDPSDNGLDLQPADPGQGGGTFRAASLRNIRRTAPYMHDGRFATLREVIDHYDRGIKASPSLSPVLRERNSDAPRRLNLTRRQKQALEAILDAFTDQAMLEDEKFSDPFR